MLKPPLGDSPYKTPISREELRLLGQANWPTTQEIYQHIEQRARQGIAETVAGQLMSHPEPDVTWNVTSKDEGDAAKASPSLEVLVRPEGLEPPTF